MKEIDRRLCEESLMEFVKTFWHIVEPATPLVPGKPMEAICDHLEMVTRGEITKLLINVPPGSSKSLLVNCFWVAWEWLHYPHLRSISFSYSPENTERDNKRLIDVVTSPLYQGWWGDRVKIVQAGVTLVSTHAKGFSRASSVNGLSTGQRGDRVRLDDPISVKNANSALIRTSTNDWFRTGMANRLNDLKKSAIVVIMQRVHEDDVSGVILADYPDYVHLCIPAEFDPGRAFPNAVGWEDWRTEEGESFWPERFPIGALRGMQMPPYAYAGQYQQTPQPKGGGIIEADWWQPFIAKNYPPMSFVLASLDTAYTEKQENDQSALTIWGVVAGVSQTRIVLMRSWSDWLSFNPLIERVKADCVKFKVDRLLIEAKANGISVAQEMRRLYSRENFSIQLVNPGNLDKVARAHAVADIFYKGVIEAPFTTKPDGEPDRPVIWAEKVIHQCATFPRSTFRDLVDSTTQAITHLRISGMIDLKAEYDAEELDRSMHRPPDRPIYEV